MADADVENRLTDEAGRQAALDRYLVLDTAREPGFDKITALVRTVFGMPICAVSLVDRDRQWFKSIQGLDVAETPRGIAFCDHTIRSHEALVIDDALADPRFAENPLVTSDPNIRCYAGVPLRSPDGYNIGALCVIDTKPHAFTTAQIDILANFAGLVMDEIELRTIAHKDFLTGAATRRALVDAGNRELARVARTPSPSSLAMFDIDHFKSVNDRFGHAVGDIVLARIAESCAASLRPTDLLGRIGGEEFAILMPNTDIEQARIAVERLRGEIAALRFEGRDELRVSASFGLAGLDPALDFTGWSAQADAALYQAKRTGRNRTVIHPG